MPMRLFARRQAGPPLQPLSAAAAARLNTQEPDPTPTDSTASGTLTGQTAEPTLKLDAVVDKGRTVLPPGRYVIVYDRLGQHGRRGTPKPDPMVTSHVLDVLQLAEAVAADAERYADGPGHVEAFVDLQASGGHIHIDGKPAGTFTFSPATTRALRSVAADRVATRNGVQSA